MTAVPALIVVMFAAAPADDAKRAVSPRAEAPRPAPMTDEQLTRLRALVKDVREREAKLNAELEKAQRDLAGLYNSFELDPADAEKRIAEIADIQRKLLVNYHGMQTELRKIVDKDRFAILKQRLDNAGVGGAKPAPKSERK